MALSKSSILEELVFPEKVPQVKVVSSKKPPSLNQIGKPSNKEDEEKYTHLEILNHLQSGYGILDPSPCNVNRKSMADALKSVTSEKLFKNNPMAKLEKVKNNLSDK